MVCESNYFRLYWLPLYQRFIVAATDLSWRSRRYFLFKEAIHLKPKTHRHLLKHLQVTITMTTRGILWDVSGRDDGSQQYDVMQKTSKKPSIHRQKYLWNVFVHAGDLQRSHMNDHGQPTSLVLRRGNVISLSCLRSELSGQYIRKGQPYHVMSICRAYPGLPDIFTQYLVGRDVATSRHRAICVGRSWDWRNPPRLCCRCANLWEENEGSSSWKAKWTNRPSGPGVNTPGMKWNLGQMRRKNSIHFS